MDFEKAFDSVWRNNRRILWRTLRRWHTWENNQRHHENVQLLLQSCSRRKSHESLYGWFWRTVGMHPVADHIAVRTRRSNEGHQREETRRSVGTYRTTRRSKLRRRHLPVAKSYWYDIENHLEEKVRTVRLRVNASKTKMMKVNTTERYKYTMKTWKMSQSSLGSAIARDGRATVDVKARIRKANAAFIQLYSLWKVKKIFVSTKLCSFRSNVKVVLLYKCETWKVPRITQSLQIFINRYLWRILRIFWPNVILNKDLWKKTQEKPVATQIKKRKWKWIGHFLRES